MSNKSIFHCALAVCLALATPIAIFAKPAPLTGIGMTYAAQQDKTTRGEGGGGNKGGGDKACKPSKDQIERYEKLTGDDYKPAPNQGNKPCPPAHSRPEGPGGK
jgi:hypothetical protein